MYDSSLTLKELLKDLIKEWRRYGRVYFYLLRSNSGSSQKSRDVSPISRNMRARLLIVLFFIFLGLAGIFWFNRNIVYGQEAIGVAGMTYAPLLDKFLSFSLGSGLIGMLIHFARRRFQGFKRVFDFVAASLGLILLSPLFLIVTILIKFDSPGQVFFKQKRLGKDGRIFNMWKFRTMRHNAELETGPVWAMEEDPRITKFGHFLRKSHIDELPQLINVFRGEMSLIGPRPERPEFIKEINGHIPHFNERLRVRPGITGLAQVRYRYGASIKDAARKLKYDLLYLKRMCWVLDAQILFWTVGRVLSGEGAR